MLLLTGLVKKKGTKNEILCRIRDVAFKLLTEKSGKKLFTGKAFPTESIFGESEDNDGNITPEPIFRTCAVVPNSGALDSSKHGIDIGIKNNRIEKKRRKCDT